ncbi:MAG: hypothetical protein A2X86_13785 [Bdellovibrionales bacterium GWA2_49_15]|nr:MAG: hypothetical protein A2X86_13785 [Bdellovibrionales bacterium GWA2_49_15]HAZ13598.1 hypothetical protein [Bdellovibrionales bacterium]
MQAAHIIPAEQKAESINQALQVLNEAAESRGNEIRAMIEHDFLKFKNLLGDDKTKFTELMSGIEESTPISLTQTKEKLLETTRKIDQTIHKNPWLFLGIAVVISAMTGYLFASKTKRS